MQEYAIIQQKFYKSVLHINMLHWQWVKDYLQIVVAYLKFWPFIVSPLLFAAAYAW